MHKNSWPALVQSGKYFLLIFAACTAMLALADADSMTTLRGKYTSIKTQLSQSPFKRPIILQSAETPGHLKGAIYAVVDYPFALVKKELSNPDHWCDVLLLHLNTKYCHAAISGTDTILNVNIGKKTPEELSATSRVAFNYKLAATTQDYFEIALTAESGPMGTSDYRIVLEAIPITKDKSFIHLTYAYATSWSGRLAMQTYLATAGSDKVGFTTAGKQDDGQPAYIDGVRGVIERNTMRYYLAIDSYLGAVNTPPDKQLDKRLTSWFDATEAYPRQLHELERHDYLEMKHAENTRQKTVQ